MNLEEERKKWEVVATVDEYGCINPTFKIDEDYTSGFLKYFFKLKGKRVKVILEVLED